MAAASVRLAAPSLPKMLDTCTLAVFGAMNSTEAISLLLRPAAMSRRTSRSRLVSAPRTSPSPCSCAAPILARRARSSSARRSGLAPSLSAVCAGGARLRRPVGPGAQRDDGGPDGRRVVTPRRLVGEVDRDGGLGQGLVD